MNQLRWSLKKLRKEKGKFNAKAIKLNGKNHMKIAWRQVDKFVGKRQGKRKERSVQEMARKWKRK